MPTLPHPAQDRPAPQHQQRIGHGERGADQPCHRHLIHPAKLRLSIRPRNSDQPGSTRRGIGIIGTVNYPQARQPFWHRHPFVTGGALVVAFWLLQHGWYLSVAIPVAVVLLVSLRRRRRRAQRRRAALLARADFEHRLLMAGDPRGVHGRYPPVRFANSR